jgi:hypothetical protein
VGRLPTKTGGSPDPPGLSSFVRRYCLWKTHFATAWLRLKFGSSGAEDSDGFSGGGGSSGRICRHCKTSHKSGKELLIVKIDLPLVQSGNSGQATNEGGFAGAIWPEQAYNLAGLDRWGT